MWPGAERTFLSADALDDDEDAELYPPEVLNSFNEGNLPPHALTLKVGAPVMLLRNMSPEQGLMNGTRLIVSHLGGRVMRARIVSGPCAGNEVVIPRIPMKPSDSNECPVNFTRTQFPLRPAFAMTINKSQGQTLQRVGIYLPDPVFTHGQLYVAASRVGEKSACTFFVPRPAHVAPAAHETVEQSLTYTANVVYGEVLVDSA